MAKAGQSGLEAITQYGARVSTSLSAREYPGKIPESRLGLAMVG